MSTSFWAQVPPGGLVEIPLPERIRTESGLVRMNRSRQTADSTEVEQCGEFSADWRVSHVDTQRPIRRTAASLAFRRGVPVPPLLWRVELFSSESLGWIHFKSSSQLISIRSHQVPCSFAYYVAEGKFDGIKRCVNWIFLEVVIKWNLICKWTGYECWKWSEFCYGT